MAHHVFRVPMSSKWQVITQIAAREGRTILFVRTKFGAERLADNLMRAGVSAAALHGGRTQVQRTKALNGFKNGTVTALVATDVAARGIHVDDVTLVLHVDPPADPKDYLHRSGRTARAGESGMVVTITTPNEERTVRSLLLAAGVQPNQRDVYPGDPAMFAVTGAREPSGVPIIEPIRSGSSRERVSYERGGYERGRGERSWRDKPARASQPRQDRPSAGKPRTDKPGHVRGDARSVRTSGRGAHSAPGRSLG
jgi:superfamily II DNA/RNA helicase